MSKMWAVCIYCGHIAVETEKVTIESFKKTLEKHGWKSDGGWICPLCAKLPLFSPERKEYMALKKAHSMVDQEYEKAKQNSYIQNPLAYALHKVWMLVDAEEESNAKH